MLMWISEQKANLMFFSSRASELTEEVNDREGAWAKLKRKRHQTVDDSNIKKNIKKAQKQLRAIQQTTSLM